MSNLLEKKIESLDARILSQAEKGNLEAVKEAATKKKQLQEILATRTQAEEKHQESKKSVLIEDALYREAQQANDVATMQKIQKRTLKQEEYKALSQKYKVHTDVVEYDPETVKEQYLTTAYIDTLIQENNLEKGSINQLTTIKSLVAEHSTQIDAKRLTIKNNLVCIDGYTLPTGVTTQYYNKMKSDPEGLTYPSYAKALLTFAADITGTTFAFPSTRDKLQKGEINGEDFIKEINTPENKAIIKTLHSIVGFNSIIPVGLDKDGYVIYAAVRSRSDGCIFYRYGSDFSFNTCLVSAA